MPSFINVVICSGVGYLAGQENGKPFTGLLVGFVLGILVNYLESKTN